MELKVLKLISVLAMSSVKFIVAIPMSLGYGYNYFETLLITTTGGIIGVFVFIQISKYSIRLYSKAKEKAKQQFGQTELDYEPIQPKKKIFTRRNKFIVRTVKRFGIAGLAFLTPTILSIPVGTFLTYRYFGHRHNVFVWLSLSVFLWSTVLSLFSLFNH